MDAYISEYSSYNKHIVYMFGPGCGGIGDFVKYFMIGLAHCIKHKIALHLFKKDTFLDQHIRLKFKCMYLDTLASSITLDGLHADILPDVYYTLAPYVLYPYDMDKSMPYGDVFTFSDIVIKTASTLPEQYTAVHLRLGDKYLETDKSFVLCKHDERKFDEEALFLVLQSPDVLFFCDNYSYKMKIKAKFPHVLVTEWPVGHTSLSNTTDELAIFAVAEFYAMTKSAKIIAASKSGFSETAACFQPVLFEQLSR